MMLLGQAGEVQLRKAKHIDHIIIWQCVKNLVPLVNLKIAGIYGCSSH